MEIHTDALSLEASSLSSVEEDEQDWGKEVSSASPFGFTPDDHELLVRLVKLAQKRTYTTKFGPWKDYLSQVHLHLNKRFPYFHDVQCISSAAHQLMCG